MKKKNGKSKECLPRKRSECPVSNVLDLLGDKWTLIVIRDMLFFGKKLYMELADAAEGIPTNILADRLKRLETAGIVTKEAYQDNPPRHAYRLTAKGFDLFPILKEIIRWGTKHIPGTPRRDPVFLKEIEKQIAGQKRHSSPK
jgi:DNA-binding HxlR family transcriptional regulator